MSQLAALKEATSLRDVAGLLRLPPSSLSYLLYVKSASSNYTTFVIAKRNGGKRIVRAPVEALKLAQSRLSILLQDCLDEIGVVGASQDRLSHGFKRGKSILTNAKWHRNSRYVFNIDIEDFFPSINFGRVRGFLIQNRSFALAPAVATVLAQIACIDNQLPQGSPCSPVISNLIGHLLDMKLVRLASMAGCTYTRYADDLTFSTSRRAFPNAIAVETTSGGHGWKPSEGLRQTIENSGFRINHSKTSMMYRDSSQVVTGLVVNRRVSVRVAYRRSVRAMVHRLVRTGTFEIPIVGAESGTGRTDRAGTLNQLQGMLGFIDSVDQFDLKQQKRLGDHAARRSRHDTYRQFLIYRHFYAAVAPVLLCEGPTDNIYLKHAILRMASHYPRLANFLDGKAQLRVRLYKYHRLRTGNVLGLRDGGSDALRKFIQTYRDTIAGFGLPGPGAPIVLIHDNDSGAKAIRSLIKSLTKAKEPLTGHEQFTHVFRNLYVISTPPGDNGESVIEHLFDANTRNISYEGKSLSLSNTAVDRTLYYDKMTFARSVVSPRADTISFSGFSPLLDRIDAVLAHHMSAHGSTSPAE